MKSMNFLGVRVDNVSRDEALERVRSSFGNNDVFTIFTPNAEMFVEASRDNTFKGILNSGSLNICDGNGAQFFSKGELTKIPGVDFLKELCNLAQQEDKFVYFLGSGSNDVIQKAKNKLQEEYPDLRIAGFHKGPKLSIQGDVLMADDSNNVVIDKIIAAAPDILFVGFGHNKQERWIHKYLHELPSVKVAMGVGGSFDMIGGKFKRAPKAIRDLGLEAFWRLLIEPKRLPRVMRAVILFPVLYIKSFLNEEHLH